MTNNKISLKEDLLDRFDKLKSKQKVTVLLSALDYMQSANFYSVRDTIALAMRDYIGLDVSILEIVRS